MKNSCINFQKFQRRTVQHVTESTEKGTTPRRIMIPKFSEIYYRELQFYLTFRNSRLMVSFWETQYFQDFLKTFPGNFRTILPHFDILGIFC